MRTILQLPRNREKTAKKGEKKAILTYVVQLHIHKGKREREALLGHQGNFHYAHGDVKQRFFSFWILYEINDANRENLHRIFVGVTRRQKKKKIHNLRKLIRVSKQLR